MGDDEQSIFSWTGADPAILGRFRDDFGIADPIVLDRNRRCSRQIFEAARRLVSRNPGLFEKRLEADRDSEHCVGGPRLRRRILPRPRGCVATCCATRRRRSSAWGDYAVLYRSHRIGQQLETRLIEAGIPCLMARGQALLDDELIGVRRAEPSDHPGARRPARRSRRSRSGCCRGPGSTACGRVLPRTSISSQALRDVLPDDRAAIPTRAGLAVHLPRREPRRAGRTHDAIARWWTRCLAQGLGPYRNPLDERAAELSDPAEVPGAAHLAERLAETRDRAPAVWLEPDRGIDLALLPMLQGRRRGPGATASSPAIGPRPAISCSAPEASGPLLLFKALQLLQCRGLADPLQDYVAFDLETTEMDPAECEIVELAAVRVRGRVIVDQFQRLVRPSRPISPQATAVHGYHDADVCDEPTMAEVWPAFREFVGDDLLVAHNGHTFDVPVLRRARGRPAGRRRARLLRHAAARPLADGRERRELPDSGHRFGVSRGRSHHAVDDAAALVGVVRHLGELGWRARARWPWCSCSAGSGWRLALDAARRAQRRRNGCSATSPCRPPSGATAAAWRRMPNRPGTDAPSVEELIERLGGRAPAGAHPERAARRRSGIRRPSPGSTALVEAAPRRRWPRASSCCSTGWPCRAATDSATDEDRVSLLTLHATKGLEFSRVYIVGAEDNQLPGVIGAGERRPSRRSRKRAGCCTSG